MIFYNLYRYTKHRYSIILYIGRFADGIDNIWKYLGAREDAKSLKVKICLEGFKDISTTSKYCYMIAQHARTWENANVFCKAKQGALVMLKNKEDSDLIKNVIAKESIGIGFWIGLRKNKQNVKPNSVKNNKWAWVDGERLASDSWEDWENDKPHKQDCVMLSHNRGSDRFVQEIYFSYLPQDELMRFLL